LDQRRSDGAHDDVGLANPAEDFVTGFLNADNQARGRPVGLAVDRAGGFLIADDLGNTVWRVSSLHDAPARISVRYCVSILRNPE
jgi:glucose/arabinose dehydrogenase